MNHIEAMKQALEALEEAVYYTSAPVWSPSMTKECNEAITSLRQAIANEALDKKAENARELGLDYEPVQAEKRHYCPEWDFLEITKDDPEFEACLCFSQKPDAWVADVGEPPTEDEKQDVEQSSTESKETFDQPVSMRMPKVGDRVICIEDESLATVESLTAGGSPDIKFDDGSHGTYILREFAKLFRYADTTPLNPVDSIKSSKTLDAQPQREWVELTDEEMHQCAGEYPWTPTGLKCARAIEAKLKEKNQ